MMSYLKLINADLTTGAINGTGTFDKLMVGVAAQLQGEYDAGRITGAEYTKAYITLTQSALVHHYNFYLVKMLLIGKLYKHKLKLLLLEYN
jgi:hypothetical protein